MSNTEKNLRDVFLVITHHQKPAKGEKTHVAGWAKTGKWEVYESAIVTDSLKTNLSSSASVIINVTKSRIEKNRFREKEGGDDKAIYLSYMQKFSDNIAQFYVKFRPQIIEEMLEAKKQEETNKAIKEMGEKVDEEKLQKNLENPNTQT